MSDPQSDQALRLRHSLELGPVAPPAGSAAPAVAEATAAPVPAGTPSAPLPQPPAEATAPQAMASTPVDPASPPAVAAPTPPRAAHAPAAPMTAHAEPAGGERPRPASRADNVFGWMGGGLAMLAAAGWVIERRRRRLLEMEKDSVLWADRQSGASVITTVGTLDDILPDSPDPAEAARSIYVTSIGETTSRREATLIDRHQLHGKLRRRRERGDNVAAVLLLQQHLMDFRYTSPWVFLELLELYRVLDRQKEWDGARDTFRKRFGQNAPPWSAPSGEHAELVDDAQISAEITRYWPYREVRMHVIRWMLGEPEMRQRCSGPPLLPLGVYRDMMLLDNVLDAVMVLRPVVLADSLL